MKKKILFICESLGGGVRRHIVDVLSELNKNEFDIFLIYNPKRSDKVFIKNKKKFIENNIKLYPLIMEREISLKDINAFINIFLLMRKIKPDIVHCHSSKAGALGRIAAFLTRRKAVYYTPHAYIMQTPNVRPFKKKVYMLIEKLLGYITSITINVSFGERNFAINNRIVRKNKTKVIYNGISPNNTAKLEYNLKKEIIIGTVARMDEQKDPLSFYKIASNVVNHNPNVKFYYVGDGPLKHKLEKKIKLDGLNDKIILTGFQEDVSEYLKKFDIFLLTSKYEGLPYSLIEAISYGIPIVATNIIGNNEIVIDGINGYTFDINDISLAEEKICYLIKNPKEISNLGKNGYCIFNEKFTLDKMIQSLEKLYRSSECEE
ncbi:glycosyltransferase family 4 protein [Heyndrickxia coagulans]|uniref:glycosyltransferase family 4 protein n=1 Tax=Heyndrickxia coagulans TaxID=1398 RepID=UPI002E2490DB|nr:glycosyltransferase family 4 protein [Heyndrickxia coagulans]